MVNTEQKNQRPKRSIDYYVIFLVGWVWLAIGVPTKNYAFCALGAIFIFFGLLHKNDWRTGKDNKK